MPAEYPYTIQGQGANIYVINSSVRASYKALDLFTYKCDNHYVDFLGGHCFNVGVKVGNNCKDGKLFNEIFKGEKSRKEFFNEILDILTLLGGELGNVR